MSLRPSPLAALLAVVLCAAGARAQEEEDNPWVDGPEPAHTEDDKPPSYPPREPGAPQQDLTTPEMPRDPWKPPQLPILPPRGSDLRFSTTLTRAELEQWGDAALTDGLALVPGLYLPRAYARGELPAVRGLDAAHTQVRLDGVPVLPASAWPTFAMLGTFDTSSVERVTFRHGARLSQAGGATGAGGVLDIDTRARAVDWGTGVPLVGHLRGVLGGPDTEKGLYGAGATGYRGVRAQVTAGGFDHDSPTLGRDAGLLQRTEGVGGHVGVGLDVEVSPRLQLFARWRSVRHRGNTLPALCREPGEGERLDCVFIDDRAFDLAMVGLDGNTRVAGITIETTARAHAQHHGEFLQHSGGAVVFTERTFDDHWRGGGLGDIKLTIPTLVDVFGYSIRTTVRAGGEVLKDRIESRYEVASRRNIDALPGGQAIADPARARRTEDATSTMASLFADVRMTLWRLALEAGVRADGTRLFSPALAERVPAPFLHDESLAISADVALRMGVTKELFAFVALTRSQRGARLFARTLGPERFAASPLPALPLTDAFTDHAAELGLAWTLPWLTIEGVTFAGTRTGPLRAGEDPLEAIAGDAPARLVRDGDRRYAGLEGRAEVRADSYGLALLATAGAVLLDEGTLVGAPVEVAGVPGPAGLLNLSWRPPDWPFGLFTRMRYSLPQARLSPEEAADGLLCPEAARELPCFGAPGFAIFDLGATVTPSDQLELGVLVENLLDAEHSTHGHPLPGQGLGARFTATLRL
jgi:outer membrane receptor protein involved in Fe transport